MSALQIKRVDYLDAQDAQALVFLLDAYAQDPMGGGEALNPENSARLCSDMARIAGYSTFKAKPLLNVHDIAVLSGHRGQGIGQALLNAAEDYARTRGCCKLTLEVLSGNAQALSSYKRFGFTQYELAAAAGQAQFMQKWL